MVLVRRGADDSESDVLPEPWSVRNSTMGYGGRPYLAIAHDRATAADRVVFTEYADGRVHVAEISPIGAGRLPSPRPLTPADPEEISTCCADLVLGPDEQEVWCVREITTAGDQDPAARTDRASVAIPLDGSAVQDPSGIRVVARSHHFSPGCGSARTASSWPGSVGTTRTCPGIPRP